MIYTSSRNEDIPILRGEKLNRGHSGCTKVLPAITERIKDMFNYHG